MKQFDIKAERVLNKNKFYIRPFPAFTATNMSGELASIITPLLASLAPLMSSGASDESVLDMDAEVVAPHMAKGLSALSGDKVEALMKKLLVKYRNISVELDERDNRPDYRPNDAQILTEDLANEIFCGEAQDMFILAWDVIKVNFGGFFQRISGQFGAAVSAMMKNPVISKSMESWTNPNSQN